MNSNTRLMLGVVVGLFAGIWGGALVFGIAEAISKVFMNFLQLVSLPIIFLSIVSTVSSMDSAHEVRRLGKKVLSYTLLTTIAAALVALGLFTLIQPVDFTLVNGTFVSPIQGNKGYLGYLVDVVPKNFLEPFVHNQVIGVLILASLLSFALLSLPEESKKVLHPIFKHFFHVVMKITSWIILFMPIAIACFIALFFKDLSNGLEVSSLGYYLLCITGSNLVQALIVLPLLLKLKGISPIKLFKAMSPALSIAFFSKSSNAALPLAMQCMENSFKASKRVTHFTLPLCTTINMNGCAAFILTTVLFVAMSNGMSFSWLEMIVWVFVATIAAVGNAGVPMGCYFLSSALLAALGVPLNLLGIILPFYALIDMLETAINVWSDATVTAIVDKEMHE